MMNEGGLVPTNLAEVIDKFNQSIRKFAIKETEWLVMKGNYETRIAELEGQLKAHENINIDLLKRIKMLEYALNQERLKNQKLLAGGAIEAEKDEMRLNNNQIIGDIEDKRQLLKEEDLKAMREKTIRPSLIAMLNDIGINENLANNLFIDLELNKTELERLIKANMDEKLNQVLNPPEQKETSNVYATTNQNVNKSNSNVQNINPLSDLNQNTLNIQSDISENIKKEQSVNNQVNQVDQPVQNYQLSLSSRYVELKSHFDVVRKIGYLPSTNSIVSVSEDCLIKVWSLNNVNYSTPSSDIEPYLVLRGHTGPLYSLAIAPDNSNMIYTAGNEGIIKIWKLPKPDEVTQYGDADMTFNCNIGIFQIPNEVIWDLKYHPRLNLLVSLSSDGFLNVWETGTPDEHLEALAEMQYEKWLKSSRVRPALDGASEVPIPTTCCFLNNEGNQLICGFNDSYISIFDFYKNSFSSNIKIFKNEKNEKNYNLCDYQPNCLINSTSVPTIYGGFEDSTIKSIDIRSESVTHSIVAHADSVTSLSLFNDIYLFSTSHDTKIRMWDIRYLNSYVQETIGSQKKWDEAMWHSLLIPDQLTLATAGADSVIKLFKL